MQHYISFKISLSLCKSSQFEREYQAWLGNTLIASFLPGKSNYISWVGLLLEK